MTDPTAAPDTQGEAPSASPTPGAKPQGFFRRRWLATTVVLLIATPVLVFTVWAGIALSFSYSEGTRTGFVQKLSKKGWVCKTWEGEMAMTAQPGVAPVLFMFSVRSDSVAAEITAVEGKQVTLTYEEHQGVPSSCFGETAYFVTGVRQVSR